ncbi:MAG: hypothetical protein EOM31_10615 [Bacteroidia bacterium]|jgi:hypothetical protein|nr:hypothetical protein [Bacteroidia bacterium]
MGKSDLLKDGMKGGLNGLISSTTSVKSEEKKTSEKTVEKESAVHCNFIINKSIHKRMKYLAIDLNKSLKDIVNEAMEEYLAKYEK